MEVETKIKKRFSKNFTFYYYHVDLFNETEDLKKIMETSFKKDENFINPEIDFSIKNLSEITCLIEILERNENYMFGRYSEIKDVSFSQNASLLYGGKDIDDENYDIKYKNHFLIDYNKKMICFIHNRNANNFIKILREFIIKYSNYKFINFSVVQAKSSYERIKEAKSIKSVIFKQKSDLGLGSLKSNFNYINEYESYILEVKIKKNKINKTDLLEHISSNKMNNITLKFINKNDIEETIDFMKTIIGKTEKILLTKENLKDENYIKNILLNLLIPMST